jgi:hypothetical protein
MPSVLIGASPRSTKQTAAKIANPAANGVNRMFPKRYPMKAMVATIPRHNQPVQRRILSLNMARLPRR